MQINQVTIHELDELVTLFDNYRLFYQQPSDVEAAKIFLRERIEKNESVIFLAKDDSGNALGFTQLYPTFSSVRMVHEWILNDLFVADNARKLGVANALMQAAETFAKANGAASLSLSTAIDNIPAQTLYEKRGWQRVKRFYHYNKTID